MAFRSWRLALEVQKSDPEACKARGEEAMKWAETDGAKQRVQALLDGKLVGKLNTLEAQKALAKDESADLPAFRFGPPAQRWFSIPVLSPLARIQSNELRQVPLSGGSGAFAICQSQGANEWMTIPGWPPVKGANRIFAVMVPDISTIPAPAFNSKNGPCMLICSVETPAPVAANMYLASKGSALMGMGSDGNEMLELVPGGVIIADSTWQIQARVLMAAEPPLTERQ